MALVKDKKSGELWLRTQDSSQPNPEVDMHGFAWSMYRWWCLSPTREPCGPIDSVVRVQMNKQWFDTTSWSGSCLR